MPKNPLRHILPWLGIILLTSCGSGPDSRPLGGGVIAVRGEHGRVVEIDTNPVPRAIISSTFGERRGRRRHQGIDYAAPTGTPIHAAGDGCIQRLGRQRGYGRFILLRHDRLVHTAYAHLSAYAPGLKIGDCVRRGQLIGRVGTSGNATGPHLHFELRHDGRPIDPLSP